MHAGRTRILLVSGSTRGGSGNTAALRTMRAVAVRPVTAVLYEGLASLPAFNPDDDREPLPPAASALRQEIAKADAVVFCTPEYAGTPGPGYETHAGAGRCGQPMHGPFRIIRNLPGGAAEVGGQLARFRGRDGLSGRWRRRRRPAWTGIPRPGRRWPRAPGSRPTRAGCAAG